MEPIEIPIVTLPGKVLVVGCCLFIVVVILWWSAPKLKAFLNVASGRLPRPSGMKNIHLVFGFFVYPFVFALAAIAAMIGCGVATESPTLVSSTGITGGNLVCDSPWEFAFFSCTTSFGESRKLIQWNEIDRVDCLSRSDGTIAELDIHSGTRQIEIGSVAVRDLRKVHEAIRAHTAEGAVMPCYVSLGRSE
jgi:hypothetical protein